MDTSRPFVFVKGPDTVFHPGKVVCVGRNYAEHAKEMNAPVPDNPVLFLKPPGAIVHSNGVVERPSFSKDLQYEVEMVLVIGTGGKHIPEEHAANHIAGYGVGLDMTLRDVQAEAKKKGLPWAVAKGFDTSAPVSQFIARSRTINPNDLTIGLSVNGVLRQNSNTRNMLFSVERLVSYISSIFTLECGDLIFTGTPEGVGTVVPGDHLRAELQEVGSLEVTIGESTRQAMYTQEKTAPDGLG